MHVYVNSVKHHTIRISGVQTDYNLRRGDAKLDFTLFSSVLKIYESKRSLEFDQRC